MTFSDLESKEESAKESKKMTIGALREAEK